jgi:predicted metal-dependent phosphoesterase TrpH
VSAPGLLRVDMHVHTHDSYDCLNRPEDVVATATARGIDRVIVTDHNTLECALRLRDAAPDRVIVGEEVRTREGPDIIGIFLEECIPKGTPMRETCERIRGQGGVVYVPHPFDGRRRGGGALLEAVADVIDVVEAHNARTWRRAVNEQGEAWAKARGLPVGAGSDAHTLREVGTAWAELPPFTHDRESFLTAIRAGRVGSRAISSPIWSLASSYAKLHKRVFR